MYITKDLNRSFKLYQSTFVLENLLHLFDKKVNDFDWKVNKWYGLWIFSLILHYVIIEVINDDIHDENDFIRQLFLGYTC